MDIAKRLEISGETLYRGFLGGRPDPPPGTEEAAAHEAFLGDLRARAVRKSMLNV